MSDDSDFSDEEIPLSASKHATRRSGKLSDSGDGGYRITGALKVPRPTSYTTQALYEQVVNEDIDLNPDYQRDVVWSEQKQIGIIDSIFRNFYVPPLIFAVTYREDGSERRICIDGKQRLTSISKFMSGEIYHKDAFTKEKFVFKDIGRFKGIKVLPDRYIKIFKNKQIVCIEYQDLSNENEREIFQRVQLGMALTPAEKLQAISSPTASFVRKLQQDFVSDGLAVAFEWDLTRGGDFRCLAHAVYNMQKWPALNTVPGIPALQKMLQDPQEPPEDFCNKVRQSFDIFLSLARDLKNQYAFKISGVKKVAPVEFIAIATLVHVQKYKLTHAQLAEAIYNMRKDIREKEVDIRMNSRVMKAMTDFIKELKASQLKPDPSAVAAAKLQPLKRKRAEDTEEDASPEPKKRVGWSPPPMLTASQAHAESLSTPVRSHTADLPRSTQSTAAPPRTAPPSSASAPDRLAALRAAKAYTEPESSWRPIPSEPAALRHWYSSGSGDRKPPVHMLPTPPPPSEPAALRHLSQRTSKEPSSPTLYRPPPSPNLANSVMARMAPQQGHSGDVRYSGDAPRQSHYPPQPYNPVPPDRHGSYYDHHSDSAAHYDYHAPPRPPYDSRYGYTPPYSDHDHYR